MNTNEIKYGVKYFFMNNILKHIPFWCVRKFFYRLAGMKIGNSHILMNVETDGWENIVIGDGARWITDCVNEFTPNCEREKLVFNNRIG